MSPTKLTSRFEKALTLAHRLHQSQIRKSTSIPYISHLLAVSALVLEDGGEEDEAIAALLHDAVEDQGGRPTLRRIEREFGPKVAALVEGCTDAFEIPKPPWKARKEAYLKHLALASTEVLRVKTADLLHNVRSTLKGFEELGPAVWARFSVGRDSQLWYYRKALGIVKKSRANSHIPELARTINRLAKLSA